MRECASARVRECVRHEQIEGQRLEETAFMAHVYVDPCQSEPSPNLNLITQAHAYVDPC